MTDRELSILIEATYDIEFDHVASFRFRIEENPSRSVPYDYDFLRRLRLFRCFCMWYNVMDISELITLVNRPDSHRNNRGMFPEHTVLLGRPEYPHLLDVLNRLERSFIRRLSAKSYTPPDFLTCSEND